MFNNNLDFYPTPKHIIRLMLDPYRKKMNRGFSILDPEAGKGDILDYIENDRYHSCELYAIEKDHELQHILKDKGYRLIGEDFLEYDGDYSFDLIVMNPPFSNGAKHLLKAWQLLKSGNIVCLLNAETINNPYTKERQLLASIIEENGSIEYLGSCFDNAERKTGVEVVMIRLKKSEMDERFEFDTNFERDGGRYDFRPDDIGNQVARAEVMQNIVDCYNATKEAFQDYIKARRKVEFYAKPLFTRMEKQKRADGTEVMVPVSMYDNIMKDCAHPAIEKGESPNDIYNRFVTNLKQHAWKKVFRDTKVSNVMTKAIQDDFENFQKHESNMAFNVPNIIRLFDMLFLNQGQIMEKCLMDVFEKLTSYDKKNKIHYEGWAHNSAYKVNKKVIIPYVCEQCDYSKKIKYTYWGNWKNLTDIDKVMCFLSGRKFDQIESIQDVLSGKWNQLGGVPSGPFDNKCESTFFKLTFYKKGTLHIQFKDEFLWKELNIRAAKGKNWLPEEADNFNKNNFKKEAA